MIFVIEKKTLKVRFWHFLTPPQTYFPNFLGFISDNASGFKRPNAVIFQRQPTSSSHGMGRASDPSKLDTQSLIVCPVSTPTPSIDAGRETPAVTYRYDQDVFK